MVPIHQAVHHCILHDITGKIINMKSTPSNTKLYIPPVPDQIGKYKSMCTPNNTKLYSHSKRTNLSVR